MKYEINQRGYFIVSRGGQIEIHCILVDQIKLDRSEALYYSGFIQPPEDYDCDRETMREDRLFPSYEEALNEIQRQLNALRNQNA